MDIAGSFVPCFRRMIESCDVSPEISARQISAIMLRVRNARRGGPPSESEKRNYKQEANHHED